MVDHPLSVLMLAGIRDILHLDARTFAFHRHLWRRVRLGVRLSYIIQEKPLGLAHGFILGKEFVGDGKVALILGDNVFDAAALALNSNRLQSKTRARRLR